MMQRSTRHALLFAGLTALVAALIAINLLDTGRPERGFRERTVRARDAGVTLEGRRQPDTDAEPESLVSLAREIATGRADPVIRNSIEESFLQEDRDPAWATRKERQLALVVGNMIVRFGSLLDVECRQTVCSVSVLMSEQQDVARLDDFSMQLERSTNMEILGDIDVSREGNGTSLTVFLSRLP
jgi:hypothetical protein